MAEICVGNAIDGALVYRKSARGVVKLAANDGGQLSPVERHVLILVDGRRTVAELSELFGSDTLLSLIPALEGKGLLKRVDPRLAGDLAGAITQFGTPLADAPAKRTRKAPPVLDRASASDLPPAHDPPPARQYLPALIASPRHHPEPASRFPVDQHPLAWFGFLVIFAIACTEWLADRFQGEVHRMWWADYTLNRPVAAISHPPAVEISAGAPASVPLAVPPIAPRGHAATGRRESEKTSRVHAPVASVEKSPAAKHAAASASKVRAPAAPTPSAQVETAAATIAPPSASSSDASAADLATRNPGTDVAIATARVEPASDAVAPRPLRHDPPHIPQKAVQDGVVEGHAQVRVWITPEGTVDQVDVLEASPPGVLDDEVRRVLSLWTFEPPRHPMSQVLQLTLEP